MLEDFRRMAVSEKAVGLEILIHFHKVEVAPRILTCSAGAGLAVANNRRIRGDPARISERPERQNNACRVAARIGYHPRSCNFLGIKLGDAISGSAQPLGVRRWQFVPGGERLSLAKAKGAAQIHHTQTRLQESRPQFRGNFVRSRKEHRSGVGRDDGFDRKGAQGCFRPAAKLGKALRQAFCPVSIPNVESRSLDDGMAQENARQFQAAIACDADNGDLSRVPHFTRASIFLWSDSRVFLLGVMMRTVSSPAMVPAISVNFAPSTAAAKGCAPLGGVLSTRRFSAGRMSSRNSASARASGGKGVGSSGRAEDCLYPS